MKSFIALVLCVAAFAAQTFALPTDCVKHASNVDRHTVRLYDTHGLHYELGANCLAKQFHPTEVLNYPHRSCNNCGNCHSCRNSYYPHHPYHYGYEPYWSRRAF
ncbi:uncharacterized protein LOC128305169 [Anopheles moucheti]|uniref:uncharacterized protein LOC128305169 n=1 Tax=Anopheles moucheti TaxID=186751 RepID=UPI0022EFEF4F|nr:uncharacterized protein LOC128305169 [Anopheles moucheti]